MTYGQETKAGEELEEDLWEDADLGPGWHANWGAAVKGQGGVAIFSRWVHLRPACCSTSV